MASKLFVGGLPWATDEQALRGAFGAYGAIEDVAIVRDRETGRSRGFGFVVFTSASDATTAMNAMNGAEVSGRRITVREAQDRPGELPTSNRTAGVGTGGYVGIALAVFFTLGCIFGGIVFALRKNPPAGAKAGTAIAVPNSARTSAVSVTTDDKADDVVSGGRTFNDKI